MYKFNCEIVFKVCIAAVILSQFVIEAEKSCSTVSLVADQVCGENETCTAVTNQSAECRCRRNYQRLSDKCVPIPTTTEAWIQDPVESSSRGSLAAGLLIPLFLISLAALLFMSARRYKWVQRFRQYQQNRYGNVLVTRDDDDDDDPPIV